METFTIQKCPLCEKSHTYELEVERSYIIKMLTINSKPEPQYYVRFTRLFNCPDKNDNYQATLSLIESSDDRIKSVTIKGIKS